MAEPFEPLPLPWTARQVIATDWQLFDANDQPVLGELLSANDAAILVRMINSFEDRYVRYHALKELILANRRLDAAIRANQDDPLRVKEDDPLYADIRKALAFYADYWSDEPPAED